jgi:ubiquinone/menaquinone biosynthesis C-methylase UbiE
MSNSSSLPEAAQGGFAKASDYDLHRPSYPPEAVEQLLSALKVSGQHGATIVDLGAGTGKLTEPLAKRDEGYEIVAIEPHDGMRGELKRKKLQNVKTMKGTAAKIPLESHSVDAVIAAQVSAAQDRDA